MNSALRSRMQIIIFGYRLKGLLSKLKLNNGGAIICIPFLFLDRWDLILHFESAMESGTELRLILLNALIQFENPKPKTQNSKFHKNRISILL